MCGIAGYFGKGNKEILEKMTRQLHHRGPDDEGFFIDSKAGLGHTRLSIIDLSPAGHQPMSNLNKTIWIVFNGEIYNFKELREDLEKRGYKFKSNSDTEIIIYSYEEYREKCFDKFNGMFAIVIYDVSNEKLVLARDKMGKKPLYWGVFDNTLIFGSELKSLMQHPLFKKELNLESVNKYFAYEYVPTPHSIFKNVYKLEAGHYLEYEKNNIKKNKFWDINFNNAGSLREQEIKEQLDCKINEAVRKRLVSDVPLGIFLSGGLDSSTIAYYAQKNSLKKVKTFSIGFKESSFDESQYARLVANYLGTEHYEKILSAKDSLDLIPEIAELLDEPMADASIIPTFLLSKFTKERVTVALGGDGGDELFCGYDTFKAHRLAEVYEKIPLILRKKIIEKIALNLPTSFSNISFDFKVKSFINGFYGKRKYRDARWIGSFGYEERSHLFKFEIWEELKRKNEYEDIDLYLNSLNSSNYYSQLIYLYLRMYMMDDILVKVDRASMFSSLEARSPLLDYELVEYVNNLPLNFKIKGLETKYILKKLMENKLPKEIVYRKKKGFGIPIAEWISKDLQPLVLDLLSKERIEKQGLFNYEYIKELLDNHFLGQKDNRKLIWTLIIFQMWQEKWLDNLN